MVTNLEEHVMTKQMNKACRCLALAGAAALVSCSPSAEPVSKPIVTPPRAASQPLGAHWIQDQRLRTVMSELSKRNPNWPAGLAQDPETPGEAKPSQFNEVASLAGTLASAADRLPELAGVIKMSEADRRGFLAEAHTLRDQAVRLQDAAHERRTEQMQLQMDLINSTCISCHSRYRDFSGQLNTPKASASSTEYFAGLIDARPNSPVTNR